MGKRQSMSRGRSKKVFSRGAMRVHPRNVLTGPLGPMRGGIRL